MSSPALPPNRFGSLFVTTVMAIASSALLSQANFDLLSPVSLAPGKLPALPTYSYMVFLAMLTITVVILDNLSENHETARFRPPAAMITQEEKAWWDANADSDSKPSVISESDSDSGDDSVVLVPKPPPQSASSKSKDDTTALVWREEEGKSVLVPKFFLPKNTKKLFKLDFKMSEIAQHNTRKSCWIVIEGHVYDVTNFIDKHPGGWLPMVNMGGKDCTDAFANYHPFKVYKTMLPSYYIGDCVDTLDDDPFTQEHRAIRQELLRRGLFETNNCYYYLKFIWLICLLLGSLFFTLLQDSTRSHMGGALLLATFWQQQAFVGHDVGHNAVSHKKFKETWLGVVLGNMTGGISIGWWKRSHNVHHIVCNSIEHDPDIQHLPVFAVSENCFDTDKLVAGGAIMDKEDLKKGFYSTYHEKYMTMDFLWKFLVSYQHFLFYPIMAVARFNLYAQGIIFIYNCKQQDGWHAKNFQKLEAVSMAMFLTGLSYIFYSLPSNERFLYAVISHGCAGLLHVQICISHFTMSTYHGHAYNDTTDEWFKMQCRTTMNVACSRWFDFFHGGLQFQIEHHLYPRLPRHNLREARALVKPLCEKWDVRYHEPTFVGANIELISSMRAVALKCSNYGLDAVGGAENTSLYEGLMAEG